MENTNNINPEKLKHLYDQGLSMKDVSKILNCSLHKVAYWMDKFKIKRRSISDALYLKLNPQGDPFKIKTQLSDKEILLMGVGLGIYWGEGNKVSPHSVRVANTDPNMLKFFITFLTQVCGVAKSKIGYSLVCFNNSDINVVVDFWSKELQIEKEKFGKIVQIPPQGKGNYRRKSTFGVCTVSVHNVKFKTWIIDQIQTLNNQVSERTILL